MGPTERPAESSRRLRRLVLASASPRRIQLLREKAYVFEVVTPPHAEPTARVGQLSAEQHAEALAYYKARSVATSCRDALILAADTVAAHGDWVFGKPKDADEARSILLALAGTSHRVITGVALLEAWSGRRLIRHETTRVTMRPIPANVLDRYIQSDLWRGKAGAYGVQDRDDAFIERIDGSFTNVLGLPIELLQQLFADFEYSPPVRGPGARTVPNGSRQG